ncbi:MAG: thiosulfate oxidation carrier protein SoxY [Gammaproteobacteria bacterium]|nr:thiosulfate oxidation carrier protein SoxY [Gammaproteobacteria bacterium]
MAAATAAGLLRPSQVLAEWPAARFAPRSVAEALADLTGGVAPIPSAGIRIRVPDTASDPRSVPLTIEATLPAVTEIWLVVAENTLPVVAAFQLEPQAIAFVSLRTKMAKTSDLIALVRSQGSLYTAQTRVQVPAGDGCAA